MAFTKVTNAGIGSTGTVLLKDVNATGIVTAGLGVSTVDGFFSGVTTTSTLKSTGVLSVTNTTESTSTTTGSVIISGGVGIAKTLHVGGSVSIGGTLTYEDVTNVDSVGLITARSGVYVSGGQIKVGTGITLSTDGDGYFTGISTFLRDKTAEYAVKIFNTHTTGQGLHIRGGSANGQYALLVENYTGVNLFEVNGDGEVEVKSNHLKANHGAIVSGVVTASSFSGSGANLTGVSAGKWLSDAAGITTNTPVGIETSTIARTNLSGHAGTGAGNSFHGAYLGDGFLSFNTEFSNSSGYYISTFTNSLVAGPIQLGSTLTLDGNLVIV